MASCHQQTFPAESKVFMTPPRNPAMASCNLPLSWWWFLQRLHPCVAPLIVSGGLHSEYTSRLSIKQPYSQCVCTIFIDKTCTRRKVGVTRIAQGRVRGLELQPSHGTRCLRWQTPELAGLSRRGVGNELSDQLRKSSKHVVGAAACLAGSLRRGKPTLTALAFVGAWS